MKDRRCWNTQVGNKRKILCNDDTIKKRQILRDDIYKHLSDCKEVVVDGNNLTHVEPVNLQYAMQSGIIKSIKCRKRKTFGSRCWNAKIQADSKNKMVVPICEDDSAGKKVMVMDIVNSYLAGCTKARFFHNYYHRKPKGKAYGDTFVMRRSGGLSVTDRMMAGKFILSGDAKEVRCVQKSKRRG